MVQVMLTLMKRHGLSMVEPRRTSHPRNLANDVPSIFLKRLLRYAVLSGTTVLQPIEKMMIAVVAAAGVVRVLV